MKQKIYIAAAAALFPGIFFLDIVTPLGYALWLLYLAPLLMASSALKGRSLLLLPSAGSLLIIWGFFWSAARVNPSIGVFNRSLGILVLWTVTFNIIKRRQSENAVERSYRELERRVAERTQELSEAHASLQTYTEALKDTESTLRGIASTALDAIVLIDNDGNVTFWNEAAARLFGYTSEEITGRYLHSSIMPRRHVDAFKNGFSAFRETGEGPFIGKVYEIEARKKDGTEFPVELSLAALKLKGRWSAVGVVRDITSRKRIENSLLASEKQYRTLFNAIDEGFCIIEMLFDENEKPIDYRFLEINHSFEKQTGLIAAKGKRMRELAPKHEEHWFETYGKIALTGQPARFENRAEQLHRWYDVYAFRFGQPEDRQVAILFNDITERKRVEMEINHMAHHDTLTGLPNKRLFADIVKVEREQAARHRKKMAILFLDLDRFKEVNDTLGHEAGDLLLKEAASNA